MKKNSLAVKILLVINFSFLIGLVFFKFTPFGIIYNKTASIPLGIYWTVTSVPADSFREGDLIVFKYVPPDWARGRYLPEGAKLIKRIGAIPGESLTTSIADLKVFSCKKLSCRTIGLIKLKDKEGREVFPLKWDKFAIPSNFYYAQGDGEDSFDSKYYDLVAKQRILAKAYPLITWKN